MSVVGPTEQPFAERAVVSVEDRKERRHQKQAAVASGIKIRHAIAGLQQ